MTAPQTPSDSPVVLITGAAGGLGQMSARALAQAGVTVLLLDKEEKRLNSLYDQIVDDGGPTPIVIPVDLASLKDAQFEELATMIEVECRRLDGLFHLASQFVQLSPISLQRLPDWEKAFAVNVLAPFALTRVCLPLLRRAAQGRVLLTIDRHSLEPSAFWGGFTVSQSAARSLMTILSDEESGYPDLKFNLLLPGPINSPMRERTHPGETRGERRPVDELAPGLVRYFLGQDAVASGEVLVF